MQLESNRETKKLRIGGMTCVGCESRIEKKLSDTKGITKTKVSFSSGTANVTYDTDIITLDEITKIIEELDYEVLKDEQEVKKESDRSKVLGAIVLIFAIYTLMRHLGITNIFNVFPQAQEGMSYGMLFVIGLLTSVHCVAMCGGINLSQCIPQSEQREGEGSRLASLRPSILYNLGRVISYTLIGGLVGALGSVVSFSGSAKGIVQILAGVFMVIMGLNMLNVFPWLRKLNPRMPKIFARKIQAEKNSNSPLYVGLLNGLMPCGPLQAMQLYALSTGDPMRGAISMFLFSLGTVPLMFALGALSSILSKKFTAKVMTAGAVLVVILGVSMLNSGLSLSGINLGVPSGGNSAQAQIKDGVQMVSTSLSSGRYEPITVQAGIPVKWTITAEQGTINGCNNRIFIPEYNIEKRFEVGENIVEFTPTQTGTYVYSCWMGMIRSTITVVDENGNGATNGSDAGTGDNTNAGNSSGVITPIPQKEPVPAGYDIPTDEVVVGEILDDFQVALINMEESRFTPAIVILQEGIETELAIDAKAITDENSTILFPFYNTTLTMVDGENFVYLIPSDDFVISSRDYSFYAYVKVVPDINNIDIEAIKEEVKNYETMTWDYSNLENFGVDYDSGASCH